MKVWLPEGAKTCLAYGSDEFAFAANKNKASEKVMQKCRFSKVGEFNHPDIPEDVGLNPFVLYKISH